MKKTESEILSITQEECAEVIQIISKIFRFGWTSTHPNMPTTNKERLEEEVGDLICMIDILIENKYIDSDRVEKAFYDKREKLKKWSSIYK